MTRMLAESDRHDALPVEPNDTAVLLLAGSSGRVEAERAELLATTGARVRAMRWFGGVGQRPAPHEVPIELFTEQLELLRAEAERVVIFGTSFGAEAALVTASLVPVDGVIAVAPSSVVWAGNLDGSWSSHWTYRGKPMPFVNFDPDWRAEDDPPAYVSLYERSLDRDAAASERARIAVEDIGGEVLLIAGGDDQVWPSMRFASEIERGRDARGLATAVVAHADAGHRLQLPGEPPVAGGVTMQRGGSALADAELGERAWPQIVRVCRAA